jgi:hypothetical protein
MANPDLGKFWRALQWKLLVYNLSIWPILRLHIWYSVWPLGIFYGYLVCIFSRFGVLYQLRNADEVPFVEQS